MPNNEDLKLQVTDSGYLMFTASLPGETGLNSYTYNLATDSFSQTHPGFPIIHAAAVDEQTILAGINSLGVTDSTSSDHIRGGYTDYTRNE